MKLPFPSSEFWPMLQICLVVEWKSAKIGFDFCQWTNNRPMCVCPIRAGRSPVSQQICDRLNCRTIRQPSIASDGRWSTGRPECPSTLQLPTRKVPLSLWLLNLTKKISYRHEKVEKCVHWFLVILPMVIF